MKRTFLAGAACASALSAAVLLSAGAPASAQNMGGVEFVPLKGVQPPLPDLSGIVTDKNAAIALGKALFWDTAAGSDGQA